MRIASALLVLFVTGSAHAEERVLTGDEIRALLPAIVVRGEASEQEFSPSGETIFTDHGKKSTGRWTVEGGRYCSTWPPNAAKACYAVSFEEGPPDGGPAAIIWIDEGGGRTVNIVEYKGAAEGKTR
jgi:hypothetical protein